MDKELKKRVKKKKKRVDLYLCILMAPLQGKLLLLQWRKPLVENEGEMKPIFRKRFSKFSAWLEIKSHLKNINISNT